MKRSGVQPVECWLTSRQALFAVSVRRLSGEVLSCPSNHPPANKSQAGNDKAEDEHLAPSTFSAAPTPRFRYCTDAVAEIPFLRNEVVIGHSGHVAVVKVIFGGNDSRTHREQRHRSDDADCNRCDSAQFFFSMILGGALIGHIECLPSDG